MQNYRSKSQLPDHIEFFKRALVRLTVSLVIALTLVYITKYFFFFPYRITNDFMLPEFKSGSKIYLTYFFQRDKLLIGDIVLIRMNSDTSVLLARIVARKGDRVSLKNKKLFRNGNLISEGGKTLFTDKRSPFASGFSRRDNVDEILVKEKTYFLLADNRDEGIDSRQLGLIEQDSIIGKVLF